MKSFPSFFVAALVLQAAVSSAAIADDWRIARLSGDALVFYHGRWTPLRAGDIVADDAFVRTMANGSLQFTRDHETIDVEPNTQIQIVDRKGKRFTTVRQYFGAVGVEANRENVKHFSVQTPFLAAVVKGTIFAVMTVSRVSTVAVARGKVGVQSAHGAASGDIKPGQTAMVGPAGKLSFGGAAGAAAASSAASAAASVASAVASATAAAATAAAASSSSSSSSSSSAAAAASSAGSSASGGGGAPGAASHGAAAAGANGSGQGGSGQGGSGNAGSGHGGVGASGGHGGASGNGDGSGGASGHGGGSGGHGGGPGGPGSR